MTEQPTISDELRADLCKVWALGFLDAMAGQPVEDEDVIPANQAAPLAAMVKQLAEGCINHAEAVIAELFPENPQAVYDTVYSVGFDLCSAMNAADGPTEINLN